jgi:hypothetical protein
MVSQAAVIVVHRWRTSVAPQQRASLSTPRKLMSYIFSLVEALATSTSLEASGVTIQPATVVRRLGVLMDQRLSFHQHISEICKTCYRHIQAFRHMRESLPDDVARTVACSIVTSHIDYCKLSPYSSECQTLTALNCSEFRTR